MFISPISLEIVPQIAKQTVQKAAKQGNTFFSAHAPLKLNCQDNVVFSKVAPDVSFSRFLGIPKAELEKITRIFW